MYVTPVPNAQGAENFGPEYNASERAYSRGKRIQAVLVHGVDRAQLQQHEIHEGRLSCHRAIHLSSLNKINRHDFRRRLLPAFGGDKCTAHEVCPH